MTAKFKEEGQRSFASADKVERINNLNVLHGIIFTVNNDQSVGYILQSNKDTGERANKICVRNRLADVRLFDARKPGLNPASLLKASDEEGVKHCDELIKAGKFNAKTCSPFNRTMGKGEANGERIVMQGLNVVKKPDGSFEKTATLATLTGNVTGSLKDDPNQPLKGIIGGLFFTSLPDGATIINMTMVYVDYTPYGLSLLEK